MEQTLGKRIVFHRKKLGLTQDRLAELLGVTAQAVSKWENDQSCPDITMLPKLAEVFGITTDELLGIARAEPVHTAEVLTEAPEQDETEPEGIHITNGIWEFQWDGGRRGSLWLAVWILLSGGLLLYSNTFYLEANLMDILWTLGLLLLGLSGLLRRRPRITFFHISCIFFGGYFLADEVFGVAMNREYLLPLFLLLFGFSLLVKALRKPRKAEFHIHHEGKPMKQNTAACTAEEESFSCSTSFGSNHHLIRLPRLSEGSANLSFGEMTVDLSGCEEFAENCEISLNCSFGELTVLIPRSCRAVISNNTFFAAVSTDENGSSISDTAQPIALICNASFGEITIRYI